VAAFADLADIERSVVRVLLTVLLDLGGPRDFRFGERRTGLCVQRFSNLRGSIQALLIVATLLTNSAIGADGPWSEKAPSAWDRIDIRTILYHSPWVKHLSHTKRALEFKVPDQGPSGMELRGYHAKESKEDGAETAEFYVRWVSSRTLREASARRAILLKAIPPSAAESSAPPRLDEFELAIAGPDLSWFDGVNELTLKSKCYLWVSSKRKIVPSRVEFARSGAGKVRGVLFRFPRTMPDGEPLISTRDSKVWFIEYAGGVEIRVAFNLKAMVGHNGLDL